MSTTGGGVPRECGKCHRIGVRSFAPEGDYGWTCLNERACLRRVIARTADLIERTSLGTPEAKEIRRRASRSMVASILAEFNRRSQRKEKDVL